MPAISGVLAGSSGISSRGSAGSALQRFGQGARRSGPGHPPPRSVRLGPMGRVQRIMGGPRRVRPTPVTS